jgi:ser/thr/tyr protein kinase RAD53
MYLAPEVVMQTTHEGYTQLVDSWSVGVIVFSMYSFILLLMA